MLDDPEIAPGRAGSGACERRRRRTEALRGLGSAPCLARNGNRRTSPCRGLRRQRGALDRRGSDGRSARLDRAVARRVQQPVDGPLMRRFSGDIANARIDEDHDNRRRYDLKYNRYRDYLHRAPPIACCAVARNHRRKSDVSQRQCVWPHASCRKCASFRKARIKQRRWCPLATARSRSDA